MSMDKGNEEEATKETERENQRSRNELKEAREVPSIP
jgi:hypothetical protein